MSVQAITETLVAAVSRLKFAPPVTHVYNPLAYARAPYDAYLKRYGGPPKEVVLVGMNPGPFGMAQTGVPFGDVAMVRDWMGIEEPVGRPPEEHPKRPVEGFACPRSEVSGTRLWGWARDTFKTPERFFSRFFVLNYCPLCFIEESGRNRTPDKLPAAEQKRLFAACDAALRGMVEALQPQWVLGVGAFAEKRCVEALEGMDLRIGRILHPSPASPAANRGWAEAAEKQLQGLGIRV
jgi:single-strand selective monofunctional uracil DNA glycosylase